MSCTEKLDIYSQYKSFIHSTIKDNSLTKSLWRKLFWTTGRDSDEYKTGCVDIYLTHFQQLHAEMLNTNAELANK